MERGSKNKFKMKSAPLRAEERRKKESEVNDYVIPTAEETLNLDPKNEMKLDTSNNLQQTYMSAMSAFPMKYGRKK